MEQNLVKNAILNFFTNRTDIFGEGSVYQEFEETETTRTTAVGFNSSLLFVRIVYNDKQGIVHRSTPIMLKKIPKLKITRYISNSFINEMNFYTKVIPTLSTLNKSFSSLFPKFYHGEMIFNVEDQSVIIFEDLKSRGYQMAEKKSFLDRDHLILMMRKLGQFHAYSHKAKKDIPELFYPMANHFLEANPFVNLESRNLLPIVGQPGLKHLLQTNRSYEKYSPEIANMLQNAEEIYIRAITGDNNNPSSVICHGDFLRSNVMFRYENGVPKDMVFIDLATYRYASPVIDLISVLYLSTDQPTRDEYWDTLIDEYYTALKTTFPETQVPDKSEILSQFVDRAFHAYLVATYFLPVLIGSAYENDTSMTNYDRIMSSEQNELSLFHMPTDVIAKLILDAGTEASTRVLSNLLQDMIDRGFICK